jgi:hypothetical protein
MVGRGAGGGGRNGPLSRATKNDIWVTDVADGSSRSDAARKCEKSQTTYAQRLRSESRFHQELWTTFATSTPSLQAFRVLVWKKVKG